MAQTLYLEPGSTLTIEIPLTIEGITIFYVCIDLERIHDNAFSYSARKRGLDGVSTQITQGSEKPNIIILGKAQRGTAKEGGMSREEWDDFINRAKIVDGDFVRSPLVYPYLNGIHWASRHMELLEKGIRAVQSLINDSHGVSGLHLNGDVAPWGSLLEGGHFEEWLLDYSKALNALEGADDDGGGGM